MMRFHQQRSARPGTHRIHSNQQKSRLIVSATRIVIAVWTVLVFGLSATATAAPQPTEPLELRDAQHVNSLAGHLYYFLEEEGHSLELSTVADPARAPEFVLATDDHLNLGYTETVVWLRFEVRNHMEDIDDWLLQFDYPLLDRIDIYTSAGGGPWSRAALGDTLPFAARPVPHRTHLTRLRFEAGATTLCFVRIESKSSMQIRPSISSAAGFYRRESGFELFFGLIYGVMLFMALYNTFLFLAVRDVAYLAYVFSVLAGSVFIMSLNGHAYQYLWPTHPAWANTIIPLSSSLWMVGTALFTQLFLDLRRYTPVLWRLMNATIVLALVAVGLALVADYRLAIRLGTGLALINAILILGTSIVCWARGNRSARFFTFAWIFYGIGTGMLILSRFGVLPDNAATHHSATLGLLLEVVMLSLALADKYRILMDELGAHARTLDERVEARTAELAAANEDLRELSEQDPLTRIANRRRFSLSLASEWQRHRRGGRPLGLLVCDIDDFKQINDRRGHDQGDQTLRTVAETLQKSLKRPADQLARLGGDEFVAILPETSLAGAIEVAEAMRGDIRESTGADARVTISVGAASAVPDETGSPDEFFRQADQALYQAKRDGRDRVVGASPPDPQVSPVS